MSTGHDRIPPHSHEAEQGVLGCILIDAQTVMPEIGSTLRDECFFDDRHRELYGVLTEMWDANTAIDTLTVDAALKRGHRSEAVGGLGFLIELQEATPSPLNWPFYRDIVKEKARLRWSLQAAAKVIEQVYSPNPDEKAIARLLDDAAIKVFESFDGSAGERSIKDISLDVIQELQEQLDDPEKRFGVRTGIPLLDRVTTGLHSSEMVVIAARPGCGKTSLGLNIAEHAAVDCGIPTGVLSLEMRDTSLVKRLLAGRARFNPRSLTHDSKAMRKLPAIMAQVGKSPLFIDDAPGLDIREIRTKARRWKRVHGLKLLVIDYLQLCRSETVKGQGREREIAQISNGLKALSKELDIAVVALAQLNRELEKDKPRVPRLSDLRESGSIEQDADAVWFLHPPTSNPPIGNEYPLPVDLTVAKQRNGPAPERVSLNFFKDQTRFEGIEL